MSDHEGFEMLDETFGVRSESESSTPNSPQPRPASFAVQLQDDDTGSPSHHDVLHLGRVWTETGDGIVPEPVGHAPSDNMIAISPQQMGKKGRGAGSVPENDARLKSGTYAGWGRSRLADRAAEQKSLLAEPSASKDPRSQSPPKTQRDDGGENSTINATAGREGGVDGSPTNPSSPSTTPSACLCIPANKNKTVEQNDVPFPSKTAMEEGTSTPGDTGYERTTADSPLPPAPPTAPAAPAPFGTFPTGSTAARATPSWESPTSAASVSAEDEAAVVELVGMGFDRENVVRALKECGRGESWKEAAISLLLEPQTSMMPESGLSGGGRHDAAGQGLAGHPAGASSACPICLFDIEAGEVFTVDCKEQHVFCVACLHRHCSVQLLDAGLIPACPLSSTCGHELSQEEVERVFLLKTYSVSNGNDSNAEAVKGEQETSRRALDTCGTLLTRRGLQSTGAVPCVSPECGNWMVPEGGGQRVKCGSCLIEFCGSCKRAPFHYTATCDEVVTLGRAWSAWLAEGKAAFLKAMAAQDDEHKALLDQHKRRKQQHDLAVEEAERLRLEYDRMEDWKESRCRCCPTCGRVVEKLSGCDLMICGVDAHGGNVQNGCGAKFLWTHAPPYKGDRGERKTTPFTEQQPEAAARSRHFIAEGIPLRCDRCHRDVVGPLFRCVHCPSFACCLECQDTACREPKHAHHIFQLMNGSLPPAAASPAAAALGGSHSYGGRGGGNNVGSDELV